MASAERRIGIPAFTLVVTLALVIGLIAGLDAGPILAQSIDMGTEEQQQAGKVVYDKWCAQCHGAQGNGEGIAAPFLQPRPRDFTEGKYKIRTTPSGALPTDADVTRVIRNGIPYTAMPGFPELSGTEVQNLVYHLKSFAPGDFEDPQAYGDPIQIPSPPPFERERALSEGFATYQQAGCKQCHGSHGRSDGGTAPTLRDDWGRYLRAADLTRPWTFRGGGSREDIYRTLSTGFNGTPMASFVDSLTEEQRWLLADWMVAHTEGDPNEAPYNQLLIAVAVDEVELPDDPAAADELFADAPSALFPLIGQITQPGRQFQPSTTAVEVQAVYDRDQIAFRVAWHDMAAETDGSNTPDLEAPPYLEIQETLATKLGGAAVEEDPFGFGSTGGSGGAADPWGDAAIDDSGGSGGSSDIWGQDAATTQTATTQSAEAAGGGEGSADAFSDAVAIQIPSTLPTGLGRPYFLFGDDQSPVDLWFMDLAEAGSRDTARLYTAHGSDDIAPGEADPPSVRAHFQDGVWSVVFVRERLRGGMPFPEDTYLPIAFSVWDGFQADRGNRRGLTRWLSVYVEPMERPPVVGPMLRAGLTVLGLELLILFLVRRKRGSSPGTVPQDAASPAAQQA